MSGRLLPRGLTATAVVVGVGAGLLAAGCGGDESGKKVSSIRSVDPNAASTPHLPTSAHQAGAKDGNKPAKPAATKKPRKPRNVREAVKQRVERLPEARRVAVITGVARSTFKVLGLGSPRLTVTRGGAAVHAVVGAKEACTSSPGAAARVASALRKAAPTVRSVAITVAGSGQSVSAYASGHCSDLGLPTGGKGRVVLTRRGTGDATISAFTVRSRRWTIEYVNGGQRLTVFATKGRYPTGTPLSTQSRSGRQVQTGAGRFGLHVTGTGGWVIRVRDGA